MTSHSKSFPELVQKAILYLSSSRKGTCLLVEGGEDAGAVEGLEGAVYSGERVGILDGGVVQEAVVYTIPPSAVFLPDHHGSGSPGAGRRPHNPLLERL